MAMTSHTIGQWWLQLVVQSVGGTHNHLRNLLSLPKELQQTPPASLAIISKMSQDNYCRKLGLTEAWT